jgi:hypothetical protein
MLRSSGRTDRAGRKRIDFGPKDVDMEAMGASVEGGPSKPVDLATGKTIKILSINCKIRAVI